MRVALVVCALSASIGMAPCASSQRTGSSTPPTSGGGGGGGGGVANCATPGTSAGYEACQAHPECKCDSKIISCDNGGWVTQYFIVPGTCVAAGSGTPTSTPPPVDAGVGGPPSTPPDAGVVNTTCTSQQEQAVLDAFHAAQKRLVNAIDRMNDAAAHPRSPGAARVKDALRTHFGIGTGSSCDTGVYPPSQIINDLNELLQRTGEQVISRCPDQARPSPSSTSEDYRTVNAAPNRDQSNDFSYYPNFFTPAFAPNRPRTVIHEMAHSWLTPPRTDVWYHDKPPSPICPGKAMGNADSIASFAFDLGR